MERDFISLSRAQIFRRRIAVATHEQLVADARALSEA